METSTSSTSRFRFRDHDQNMENGGSTEGRTGSDTSSVSSDGDGVGDVESELESMTGKGIKRLCSELLELKKASDEDFQKSIFSNYSAFVRIFEEMEGMENELMQLKHHVSTQKRLVKDLRDGIYLNTLSEEGLESTVEEPAFAEPPPRSILETHTDNVSEILDTLISEHRVDEAIVILEMESGTLQSMQLRGNLPAHVWMSYNSAMSERKAMLADQLTLVAENPRVSAAELQKTLAGLCRLGENNVATQLLLQYYHLRIASGIHDLQSSKTFLYGVYIREIAKFVFSMISQAARSFVVLYGETSAYGLELSQWAYEETEVFATCFNKYVKSISEISGGLSTAVEAVHFAMSYCSLLEAQRIVLRPCLIKHIQPCIEDILQIHFAHFKKVINIFTSTDAWLLGRYLVSGILTEGESIPEYCLLTNSGRKFVTLLQGITEDISSLVNLQMESSILKGLMNLFTEYIAILERALTNKKNVVEKGGSRTNVAVSLAQQVSVIANLSTLVHCFCSIIRNVFKDICHLKVEIDSYILFSQEACSRLRYFFCEQIIRKIMSLEGDDRLTSESCMGSLGDSDFFRDLMPSVPYQGLFSELRNLEKLAEDNVIEVDWLMDLLRELMEAIFAWVSTNEEIWTITEGDLTDQHSSDFIQFVLDVHFLVEIARVGGYLTNNMVNASLDLVSRMESAYVSVGLEPNRDVNDYGWAINAAAEALQKLQEVEKTKSTPNETSDKEETNEHQSHFSSDSTEDEYAISSSKDSVESLEESVNIDALEISTKISKTEAITIGGVVDLGGEGGFDDRIAVNSSETFLEVEKSEAENAANAEQDEFQKNKLPGMLLSTGHIKEFPTEEETSSSLECSEPVNYKLEVGVQTNLPGAVAASDDMDEMQERQT